MCGPKRLVPFASLLLAVAAFGAGCIGSPPSDVPLGRPQIASQPANVSVTVTTTATFSVQATGKEPLTYQWSLGSTPISSATSANYITPPTALTDSGGMFTVTVTNSLGSVTSSAAKLTVAPASLDVTTYHNDVARTGQYLSETTLTPSNVNTNTFGLLRTLSVDGRVDAQPLYLSNVTIGGAAHNVVYVVTENDSAYAFDPDSGAQLWQTSMIGSGETYGSSPGTCSAQLGIMATPVIDRTAGPNGAIYLVAMTKNPSSNTYYQRIHALDITTGAELASLGSPKTITAKYPGRGAGSSGGYVVFDPAQYKERAALLLLNGVIYTTWASHCDVEPYTGWVIGFSEKTLELATVFNYIPNGSQGSNWASGAGPAADRFGNIYFLSANGTFDTDTNEDKFPSKGDFGNAFLKLQPSGPAMTVLDYFTMHNTVEESAADEDFGSGGALILPDVVDANNNLRHLAVGMGKDGILYVLDRDSMGKFNPVNDDVYQALLDAAPLGGLYGALAYYNGVVYLGGVGQALEAYPVINAKLGPVSSTSNVTFSPPGTTPSISANGSTNGIVWAVLFIGGGSNGTSLAYLYAFPVTPNGLGPEIYDSSQASARDLFYTNVYIVPTVANGKVFVGTPNGVVVFGLF
jgi:hypothetical protein